MGKKGVRRVFPSGTTRKKEAINPELVLGSFPYLVARTEANV